MIIQINEKQTIKYLKKMSDGRAFIISTDGNKGYTQFLSAKELADSEPVLEKEYQIKGMFEWNATLRKWECIRK